MTTQFEIFKHFNVSRRDTLVKTKTHQYYSDVVTSAIYDRGWIAISGPIGSGKTETAYDVLDTWRNRRDTRVIDVFSPDRAGIKISHVMNSIIYQLGQEFIASTSPRRDMEARAMQCLNVLSSARKGGVNVVIVVDEAHELHGNTLKAIKRLREHRFRGERNLATFIMIGQPGLSAKLSRDEEVGLRCDAFDFQYTMAELREIAKHHSYKMLSDDDCTTLAHKYETPLAIVHGIFNAMRTAYQLDDDQLRISHFDLPDDNKEKTVTGTRQKITVDPASAGKIESKYQTKEAS
jgi:type II secretory pathway predicted ATPase ExeA